MATRAASILLVLLAVSTNSAKADIAPRATPTPTPRVSQLIISDKKTEFNERLNLARQLMRSKNYQGASAILEILYEQDGNHSVVINQLVQCYDHLKYYSKAAELVRRQTIQQPKNFHYQITLAEFLVRQDSLESGARAYHKALTLAVQGDRARYLAVVNSMMLHALDSLAFDLIDSLRLETNDSTLFAIHRGTVYEHSKKYSLAAHEFYLALDSSSTDAGTAEKKLMSLLEFVESSQEVQQTLIDLAQERSEVRLLRLLAAYYLKSYRFDDAFDFAVKQDSLEGFKGISLLTFLHGCRERELYFQTARMGEYIISHYPDKPIIAETYFTYADALTHLEMYDSAIVVYNRIKAIMPRSQDKAEAVFRIGEIHAENFNDCRTALVYYDSVISDYAAGLGYAKSQLARPHCFLRMGDLERAKSEFENLSMRQMNEDIKEEVQYTLSLIGFFAGEFDSCRVAFKRLTVDYPRGFYVNDVLKLLMVMDETAGNNVLLTLYSKARLFAQKKLSDSTESALLSVVNFTDKSLADIALNELATLSLSQTDTSGALGYFERMETEFPDSYYVPYALKIKADIYLLEDATVQQAREIYRSLLEEHPNYPFISNVRKIMRRLEQESVAG